MASLSPSLQLLFREIDARWPKRDRRTDGAYADPKVRKSVGHNPGARGLIHAIDVDKDGISPLWIIGNIVRTHGLYYIIWDRRVWSVRTGWDGHKYTGKNPHTDHMHIEILQTVAAETFRGPWGVAPATSGIGPADPDGTGGFGAAESRDYTPAVDGLAGSFNAEGNKVRWNADAIRGLRR